MRCEGTGLYCLHDENAEPLPGQMHVSMESQPHGLNRITVTFNVCKDVVVVGSDEDVVPRETKELNIDGL